MAFDYLNSALSVVLTGQARKNVSGDVPLQTDLPATKFTALAGTDALNAAVAGGNVVVWKVYTLALYVSDTPGPLAGYTDVDLTSLTDILLQTGISLARVKGVFFALLNATDVLADGTTGNAASSVVVGASGTNDNTLFQDDDTYTFTLENGDFVAWGKRNAGGKAVDGTHCIVRLQNMDAAVTAKVLVGIQGATT